MSVKRLVRIAMLGASLYVAQLALAVLPNVEIVSLLIVIFTLLFGRDAVHISLVYVMFTGFHWGFGLWWATYLFVWPLFSLTVGKLAGMVGDNWHTWAFVLAVFGLAFGALFAVPYIFVVSPKYALTYWIAGIPWDVTHCVANFVLASIVGKRLFTILQRAVEGTAQVG
jgi:energy-coupling factor transport system substrate-specific component